MPSNSQNIPKEVDGKAQAIAKALHRLLDIIALLVVKEIEKDRIENKKDPQLRKTLPDHEQL